MKMTKRAKKENDVHDFVIYLTKAQINTTQNKTTKTEKYISSLKNGEKTNGSKNSEAPSPQIF